MPSFGLPGSHPRTMESVVTLHAEGAERMQITHLLLTKKGGPRKAMVLFLHGPQLE